MAHFEKLSFCSGEVCIIFQGTKMCWKKNCGAHYCKHISTNLVLFQMVSGPLRALHASKVIVKQLQFACKHMDRKSNKIIFMKCVEPWCPQCKDIPIISKNVWSYVLERESKWDKPVESMEFPGHYQTFCEIENLVLISNTLSYKQVHNFVLKRNMLDFLH